VTYRNGWIGVEQHLIDSQVVYIVNHAGDSHLENSNEVQSKLMEWLLIILLVGDWRLLRLHFCTSYNTRRWPLDILLIRH